ncbi:hypothetical protein L1049_016025 [Liquidambar formosana]|uniref:UBC core domain-containing protein n=1 Tax=Liquidambar formosana TaxID=63359 RepID=A0AAP0X6Y9_LIQFO
MASGEIDETNGIDTAEAETKQFDIVTDHSDHHYANLNPSSEDQDSTFTNAGSSVRKKIMQEWNILKNNLPDTIFVQAYEGRIDLLRAVIIGPAGTPYHDGLFFFDLAFPSDYPNQPPLVYYHSHGLRLNPNLYAKGYVCLSLLNTWHGNEEEMWNPSGSTILQVLLSLQALVLNEEPYFNEPGYEKFREMPETQKISNNYSEEAFMLSCKTMLFLLQKPPKNFEDFVAQHFLERADVILRACKAYADGHMRVGYYQDDGSSSTSTTVEVSSNFKQSMDKLYADLETAFNKNKDSMQEKSEEMKETACAEPQQTVEVH